jgi:hypothetical protein
MPEKSVTYVSERVLPMSPVCTPPRGSPGRGTGTVRGGPGPGPGPSWGGSSVLTSLAQEAVRVYKVLDGAGTDPG